VYIVSSKEGKGSLEPEGYFK